MKRFVPLIMLVMIVAASCGKKTEEPKSDIRVAKPNEEMRKPDPAGFVDMHFLDEQSGIRAAVRKQIDSLRAQPVIDRGKISAIVNKRKGEIITLKRDLRASTSLTPAQRDSLVTPLEQESYELSDDLIAVAK